MACSWKGVLGGGREGGLLSTHVDVQYSLGEKCLHAPT